MEELLQNKTPSAVHAKANKSAGPDALPSMFYTSFEAGTTSSSYFYFLLLASCAC